MKKFGSYSVWGGRERVGRRWGTGRKGRGGGGRKERESKEAWPGGGEAAPNAKLHGFIFELISAITRYIKL